ncbi:MAG: ribonuclease Z [Clostridia bacterium]|nr:ribonuclease Z [Clostridia bacterium]
MLNVTLIGTAATMPQMDRATASAAVGSGGRWVLIDCGEGTQTAARRAKISLLKVDVIALTHYHGDHIFGLPGLMQTMGSMNRTSPLWITGPAGLEDALAPILTLAGELPYPLVLRELPEEGICLRDVHPAWPALARLIPFLTEHRVISQGYRVQLNRPGRFMADKARALGVPREMWKQLQTGERVLLDGREIDPEQVTGVPRRGLSVVYSGDTAPCAALEEQANGADLLICEATYPTDDYLDKAEEYGHSTFRQAGELAGRAGVRRLWLTHYSAMVSDPETYLSEAAAGFPEAVCGRDGLTEMLLFDK